MPRINSGHNCPPGPPPVVFNPSSVSVDSKLKILENRLVPKNLTSLKNSEIRNDSILYVYENGEAKQLKLEDLNKNEALSICLSKTEMLNVDTTKLPDVYFALCKDDGKMYLYNVENSFDENTGKYRELETSLNFNTVESKETIEQVLTESETVQTLNNTTAELSQNTSDLEVRTESLETLTEELNNRISTIFIDGGEIE